MIIKIAYVAHVPGHQDSKGKSAPWVVKDHKDDHIISSYGTEAEAREGLKNMHAHSGSQKKGHWDKGILPGTKKEEGGEEKKGKKATEQGGNSRGPKESVNSPPLNVLDAAVPSEEASSEMRIAGVHPSGWRYTDPDCPTAKDIVNSSIVDHINQCPRCQQYNRQLENEFSTSTKTAVIKKAADATLAARALDAIEKFYDLNSDDDIKKYLLEAIRTLEGSTETELRSAKQDLERAIAKEDFGEASDYTDQARAKLEDYLGKSEERNLVTDADQVAETVAEPVEEPGIAASLKYQAKEIKREKDLRKKRSSKGTEFRDIFSEVLASGRVINLRTDFTDSVNKAGLNGGSKKRADHSVKPDLAEAKAKLEGESKSGLANTPVSTETTSPCDLEGQKTSPDASGVPRLAGGDINISVSTDDGKSKVKSKLPLGDGKEKKDGKKDKKEKKADQSIAPDVESAKSKLDHGAKAHLADNPDATKTVDISEVAKTKTADQSVAPDIENAKSKLDHGAKGTLADNPDATKTTDPSDLAKQAAGESKYKCRWCDGPSEHGNVCSEKCRKELNEAMTEGDYASPEEMREKTRKGGKQACTPVGDDLDETMEMEVGLGDLADLAVNMPEVTWTAEDKEEPVKAPQFGEGGINNLPKGKKE